MREQSGSGCRSWSRCSRWPCTVAAVETGRRTRPGARQPRFPARPRTTGLLQWKKSRYSREPARNEATSRYRARPAGPACIVSVTTDGTVEYLQTGGTPSIMTLTMAADEIEAALRSVIASSTIEIFGIGGAVVTCQALNCVQPHNIYVRSSSRTPEMDLSGFDFLERRNGVFLAGKEDRSGQTRFHNLGAWMDHSMFLVETARHETYGTNYSLSAIGDATGTNPAPLDVGSATWSGVVIGVVVPVGPGFEGARVDGDARISMPGTGSEADPSLDIAFTNVRREDTGARLPDMTWDEHRSEGRSVLGFPGSSPRLIRATSTSGERPSARASTDNSSAPVTRK